MPTNDDIPSTVARSNAKAQRTWKKTHDAAVREYGDGERAHRTAFGALKHTFEKVGDRWQPKEGGRKGPSDEHSAKTGAAARQSRTDRRRGRRQRHQDPPHGPGEEARRPRPVDA